MPWKTMDVQEQRVRFVVAAYRREKALAELCREFGISRPVGYEWLKRYARAEWQRLLNAAGNRSIVRDARKTTWSNGGGVAAALSGLGARKLRVLLQREGMELDATRFIAFCCGTIWCIRRPA